MTTPLFFLIILPFIINMSLLAAIVKYKICEGTIGTILTGMFIIFMSICPFVNYITMVVILVENDDIFGVSDFLSKPLWSRKDCEW